MKIIRNLLLLFITILLIQSCQSNYTLKRPNFPESINADTGGPYYRHNVSQIKFWDRITSAYNATNFAWWDSLGKVHEMNEYYNKIIVLNFFGTWSQASMDQLAEITKLRATPDTNVIFIGITQKEKVLAGKAVIAIDSFVQEHPIPYQVIIGSRDFAFGYGGIDVVPTTFVITKKRHVSDQIEGFITAEGLRAAIAKAKTRQ